MSENKNKKVQNNKNKNEQKVNDKKQEQINLNAEIEKLKLENTNLNNLIVNYQSEIEKYKSQINKINDEYIQKVTQKATEAKEILNKKIVELEEKYSQEFKLKINKYVEDKFEGLLNTIDQLTLIVNSNPSNPDIANYLQGFKMILGMFENSLNNLNIYKININVGDKFDESYMHAFELVDDNSVEPNHVSSIISYAYKYNDKIIKYASVRVHK